MEIREVDVNDDADFRRFFEALRDGEMYERDGMPMWTEHDGQVIFRRGDPTETMTAYVAEDNGQVLGSGIFSIIHNSNTDKAFLDIVVPPQHRGRGVGTALEAHFVGLARQHGRTAIITQSYIPAAQRDDHPYRRFAEHRGYDVANIEIRRILPIPVSDAALDQWAADAAPHHDDYRVETYVNDIPDELLESYCDLQGQLALEAPTGDLDFEAEVVTVEAFKARKARREEQGMTAYFTLAMARDGQVVAHSVLAVPREDPGNVYQWATLVKREHRGHRLGLATKVRNLRVMQTAHPDRRRVHTQNAEVNGPMVSINEMMGFTPNELCVEYQRFIDLEAPELVGSARSAGSEREV